MRRQASDTRPGQDLAGLFGRSFALIGLATGAAVVVAVLVLGTLIFDLQPRLATLAAGKDALAVVHQGMLDEETGLRGYLLTDEDSYLEPYRQGVVERSRGDFEAVRDLGRDATVERPLQDAEAAADTWSLQWAVPATRRVPLARSELDSFLARGKELFDAYRARQAAVLAAVDGEIS